MSSDKYLNLLTCRVWLAICLSLCCCLQASASEREVISLDPERSNYVTSADFEITHQQTLPEHVPLKAMNSDSTTNSLWLRVEIKDGDLETGSRRWLLELTNTDIQRLDLYVTQADTVTAQYSYDQNNSDFVRAIHSGTFGVPVTLQAGAHYDLYLHLRTLLAPEQVTLRVTPLWARIFDGLTNQHAFGLFLGFLLAMVLYNIFMLISTRYAGYGYYTLHIIASYLAFQTVSGHPYRLLLQLYPSFDLISLHIATTVLVVSGLLFLKHFIAPEHHIRHMSRLLNVLAFGGLVTLAAAFLPASASQGVLFVYVGLVCLITPVLTYRCFRLGSRAAGFLLASWLFLWISAMLFLGRKFDILPADILTENAIMVATVIEMLLLSYGLADRINHERNEKYKALQQQHDILIKLKDAEDQLMHRAMHSRATGLPNRTFLVKSIDDLIETDRPTGFSLLILNLNNFHEFNKTLGHSRGDAILYLITERLTTITDQLQGIIPIEETAQWRCCVAGIEGVSFAILLEGNDHDRVNRAADWLLQELEKSFEYEHLTLNIDATAGIAMYPAHSTNSENLMRNAQIALEAASANNGKAMIYSQDVDPYNARRISLLAELRNAIERNGLELYLQPQISLEDMSLCSAEALVRWQHPDYGFVSPDEFIPLAEKTGVIQPLTYLICEKAFALKARLDDEGIRIKLSINISAQNLLDAQFTERVCILARQYHIDLTEINMELTETAVMSDPDSALQVMKELTSVGIDLSVDDFGTGYSCLSYLKKLPVTEIKIDRSFVTDMCGDGTAHMSDDEMIVLTTIIMGHNLGLSVVAEGIENQATLNALRKMRCDLAQGYYISRPLQIDAFVAWAHEYNDRDDRSFCLSSADAR